MKSFASLAVAVTLFMLLPACGGGGGGDDNGTTTTTTTTGGNTTTTTTSSASAQAVSGVVVDPTTNAPVGGAYIAALEQLSSLVRVAGGTPVATATTDANGNYTMTGLQAGVTYYFQIEATGYETFNYYDIQPDAASPLTLENARTIPTALAGQTTSVSGTVKNASTNTGLPSMTVNLRGGVNNRTGTVITTDVTDTTGGYSFDNLGAGSYTAEINGNIGNAPIVTAYYTLTAIPGGSANDNQDFPVTAGVNSNQYRIVLSWGDNPSDLDSHFTGPAQDGTRFHVSYGMGDYPYGTATYESGNRAAGPDTEVFLDVDNTSHGYDNGPETTTIVVPRSGSYNFYVHHYSGSSNLSSSGAQVKVYKGSSLLATYNPPSGAVGDDDVWAVFSMAVTSSGQTITSVNQIFVGAGTYSDLDSLIGGSSGTYTNRLLIGSGFDGAAVTGTGTSFSLASLSNGGDLYAHIESGAAFETKFARLYINDGLYGQKDYCTSCNSVPLVNGTNVKVGAFRITDPGSYTLKAYAVGTVVDIGVETLLGTATLSITQ